MSKSALEEQLKRLEKRKGKDSPSAQFLRDQIHAAKAGKSAQDIYTTGSVKKEPVMKKETD
jgi:hypothetical protein